MAEKKPAGKGPQLQGGANPKALHTVIKLQIPAGKATPAPPIGPALGQHGVNIMEFCKAYNDQTKDKGNTIIPVEIYVLKDKTFTFVLKTPPASILIKKALGIEKGSSTPHSNKVGTLSKAQLVEIAQAKMQDLNAGTLDAAKKIIEGTARSMGVKVES
jgi:large subunit ribosomal protein L11